ncbi:MAG: ribbon-helix-helix domain-containing protein [Bifidobacteriaceae bacterium]|jgi:hypothetical protein|nr:ribbon-helix-helix domain-containing protein [Bifidobacteriaceae bacterium]
MVKRVGSEELDRLFDEGSEEFDQYVDWAHSYSADDPLQELSVPLPDSVVDIIDREADKQGRSRVELMRRWLEDRARGLQQ